MATSYKTLTSNDVTQTQIKLHESVPITGSLQSGSYTPIFPNEGNIKNYAHGMFQSVYDYPYLSSSANHIFDLAVGVTSSVLTVTVQAKQKRDIYNQMAQVLCGYDATGSIRRFDITGDFAGTIAGNKMDEVIFYNYARLIAKDGIQPQKGTGINNSFQMAFGTTTAWGPAMDTVTRVYDKDGTDRKTNSPAGEFNILYATNSAVSDRPVGLLFYQAGIAVLSSSLFKTYIASGDCLMNSSGDTIDTVLSNISISGSCDVIRHRFASSSFNNTTELNSTIYFCRAAHNEFNYSSNPTYLSSSEIRVKNGDPTADPISYPTTVGLYGGNNELLAVAKLSEPLKKTPEDEFILRVRLDY
tara:strand:- start:1304 stop:2374 length:1071 start_codon:yes stop_codon:yes gene_type:complete